MVTISTLDDPRLAPYRFLPQRTGRLSAEQYTIVESELVAYRLLRHEWCQERVVSALLIPEAAERLAPLLRGRGVPDDQIFVAPKHMLEEIVGYHLHQGVFVCLQVPPQPTLQDVPLPAVLLVGVSSSTNVGAIARSAAAFGMRALLCDRESASPWLRRCIRVSMGAVFELVLYHATIPTRDVIAQLRKRGARLVGAEVGAPLVYSEFAWSMQDVVIFGSEGSGLSPELLESLDVAVEIPIHRSVESLNVAAAAAIILSEHAEYCRSLKARTQCE